MAGTRKSQDKDVISQLADIGEDALRRLVDTPRRIVIRTRHGVGERLHDVARRLRSIDPLDGRVGAIEKRLDSLEQPKKTTARTGSARAKTPRASKASTADALEPKPAEHDPGRPDDARAEHERDEGQARRPRTSANPLGKPDRPRRPRLHASVRYRDAVCAARLDRLPGQPVALRGSGGLRSTIVR